MYKYKTHLICDFLKPSQHKITAKQAMNGKY